MGLFGFAEIITNLESDEKRERISSKVKGLWISKERNSRPRGPPCCAAPVIGSFLGLLPGGGAMLASFASYARREEGRQGPIAIRQGRDPGRRGPESANNAGAQTSFIPLLTLGIPENAVMAMMVGAMTIHNIQPGPQVMTSNPGLFWGLIASMWVGNLMLVVLNLPMIGIWIKLLTVPYRILYPAILMFCAIGVYTINNASFDVIQTAFFGFLGVRVRQARVRTRAAAAGLRAGADDGGKPAPRVAAIARRPIVVPDAAAVRGLLDRRGAADRRHRAAQHPQEARRSVPGRMHGRVPRDGRCFDWRHLIRRGASRSSRATPSRPRSRWPRRRASRCSRAAATPSTRRSPRRSRSTVVEPCSNGIGSDLFAIVWTGNAAGRAERIGTRARRVVAGSASPAARRCRSAAGRPSRFPAPCRAGLALSRRYGKLPFADLFEPAIRYARDGWLVSPVVAEKWALAAPVMPKDLGWPDVFMPRGRAPLVGERFACPAMAATLEKIAATQGESFYRGELAAAMVRHSQAAGGAHTLADFAAHQADWVTPLAQDYRGFTVHEIPPNGQGMSALMALANARPFRPRDAATAIRSPRSICRSRR